MNQLLHVPPQSIITGWDFSTGGVKCLAFDLSGNCLAEVRWGTDLWKGTPDDWKRDPQAAEHLSELNLLQLEGQARATVRGLAPMLRDLGRLDDWFAGGISATHHTAGRIDVHYNPLRRAICWNDYTLARYHEIGLQRLGGQDRVRELIGGPWAIRYSLSHLVKDEDPNYLKPEIWERTHRILSHGSLAAGYLTGNFDCTSVSCAASTGIMDLVSRSWRWEMLEALESPEHRNMVRRQLPRIVDQCEPLGRLAGHIAVEAGLNPNRLPLVFPTSDDQQAGLVGGGAVNSGQVAVILGNSAVVNSSADGQPRAGNLDVMRLNWGPYLWMRCYNNGAQFIDPIVGKNPDWDALEAAGRGVQPAASNVMVIPFEHPEPSLGVVKEHVEWLPSQPAGIGERYRAALESLAYLIALGVEEHEKAGQQIKEITVSGGIARSDLMCEILASVLNRRLLRLESDEGPALGAAVTSLAAVETHLRREAGNMEPYLVSDAVRVLVRYGDPVEPNDAWVAHYRQRLAEFRTRLPA